MGNMLEKIAGMKIKALLLTAMAGNGCFLFALLFLVILIPIITILSVFSMDMSLIDSGTGFGALTEAANPRIVAVQKAIDAEYPGKNLDIDGAMLSSVLTTVSLHDNTKSLSLVDEKITEEDYVSGIVSSYPAYSLLLAMAKGMIATRVTITCEEITPATGETPLTYTLVYIKELVGIDGVVKPTCKTDKYTEKEQTENNVISNDVFTKVYLPGFFLISNIANLNSDDQIKDMISEVIERYNTYIEITSGSTTGSLIDGVLYSYNPPIIVNGKMSLPINTGIEPYGTNASDIFTWRNHPGTGARQFHAAIDLGCDDVNLPSIHAIWGGTATAHTANDNDCGVNVKIRHDTDADGVADLETQYCHMSLGSLTVTTGETVEAGQQIGTCGNTGRSYGAHLHLAFFSLLRRNEAECESNAGYWDRFDRCAISPEPTLRAIGELTFN